MGQRHGDAPRPVEGPLTCLRSSFGSGSIVTMVSMPPATYSAAEKEARFSAGRGEVSKWTLLQQAIDTAR